MLALLLLSGAVATAQLGDLVKGGGIGLLVSQFGKEINSTLNRLTKTPDRTEDYATKVVPVLSVGDGKEVGAVQIMGPPEAVDKVKAVAQVEGKFGMLKMRIRAMIPIAGKNVSNLKRVPGVGISGLLDVKL
jgi:hypothetical protein